MPTHEDAAEDEARDAADGGDRAGANSTTKMTVSRQILHVLQTIVQHAAEAYHDKLKPLNSVLCMLELSHGFGKSFRTSHVTHLGRRTRFPAPSGLAHCHAMNSL